MTHRRWDYQEEVVSDATKRESDRSNNWYTMTATDKLIALLEQAKEGSRELDFYIAKAAGELPAHACLDQCVMDYDYGWSWCEPGDHLSISKYSTSIDAALTLVPPDHEWELHSGPGARVTTRSTRASEYRKSHADGATPALALCIAALKARASQPPTDKA